MVPSFLKKYLVAFKIKPEDTANVHPIAQEPPKPEKEDIVEFHFGKTIKTTLIKGGIRSEVTDEGAKKLNAFSIDQLLLYFSTILDSYKTPIHCNIVNTGPMSYSVDFVAFKHLTEAVIRVLNDKLSQSVITPKISHEPQDK